MGTSAVISIKLDGKTISTYNHSDGYPSWLGVELVEFCRKVQAKDGWDVFKKNALKLKMVKHDKKPKKKWAKFYSELGYDNIRDDWYGTLRNMQGSPTLEEIYAGNLRHWIEIGGVEALKEDRYGYCINLDDETFEFWHNGSLCFASPLNSLKINWVKK